MQTWMKRHRHLWTKWTRSTTTTGYEVQYRQCTICNYTERNLL